MTVFEATRIGPTWQPAPNVDDENCMSKFWLPDLTLGWQAIKWIADNLLGDDGLPFQLTPEQSRFLLWWYAIDEDGRFLYRNGVLQRIKGWGKDPLAACIIAVEFIGPSRFVGWLDEDMPEAGLQAGDPYAERHRRAWIELIATSAAQNVNTMSILPGLFSDACKEAAGMNKASISKEVAYAYGGTCRIRAVASNPRTLEGGRTTFTLLNESHMMIKTNRGHEMFEVVERNATKAKGGASRWLAITNAYAPSEDSVAQRIRESWESEQSGESFNTRILYDSLEIPPSTPIRPEGMSGMSPLLQEAAIRAHIAALVVAVRGDAVWLDVPSIVDSVLSGSTPLSVSRRFWFNSISDSEDAWLSAEAVAAAEDEVVRSSRKRGADVMRAGWAAVDKEDEVVVFFDGSKSDDATGLVGCRVSDGFVFTIGAWTKPPGDRGKGWTVPRFEVDGRVDEMFERFNVVMFWGDPSHTKDDNGSRYWDAIIDSWHRKYKDRLDNDFWSIKGGIGQHSIVWDMVAPERVKQFTVAAETFAAEIDSEGNDGVFSPSFSHDGNPLLMSHMRNARRSPNQHGVSLSKENRESLKKIDLAVCAVGARMLRRLYLNAAVEKEPESAGFW